VYGDSSIWHLYVQGYPGTRARTPEALRTSDATTLKSIPGNVITAFQRNLQIRGVDLLSYAGGVTSAAHTEADIDQSIAIFDQTVQALVDERLVAVLG
jgi:glutamate-1-semialdehyde aminotransferase